MKNDLERLSKLNFLLVDDHSLFREGLRRILEDYNITNIMEASSGEEVLSKPLSHKPDVVLMDFYMKELNGIETTRRLLEMYPGLTIVLLTVSDDDNTIAEALRAGAQGFLNKNMHSKEIIQSLIQLLAGKIPLSKPISRALLSNLTAPAKNKESYKEEENKSISIKLSPREEEILFLLGLGRSNREIGQQLFISESTVKNHVRNIFKKLDVTNRTQAITTAVKLGLIHITNERK
ncbi:MAG TPA: response regulator transcription factor [Tissierellia bacterium]|nr:response regulator transcription factor [Tissierellia bacterium]